MVGEGLAKGYIEVVDGLCVRGVKVSHGCCLRPGGALPAISGASGIEGKRDSEVGLSDPTQIHQQQQQPFPSFSGLGSPHKGLPGSMTSIPTSRRTPSISQLQYSIPGTPSFFPQQQQQQSLMMQQPSPSLHEHTDPNTHRAVVDSTAYFIRDNTTGREVLIFGDVEPDTLSLNPRTAHVWAEAAPKIAVGMLKAIFIECSYDDSQGDAVLFGHLCPRHLVKEISVLAGMVRERKREEIERREGRKRKRSAQRAAQQAAADNIGSGDITSRTTRSSVGVTVASETTNTEDDLETNGTDILAKRRVTKPPRLPNVRSARHLIHDFNPSPMDMRNTPTSSAPSSRNGGIAAPLYMVNAARGSMGHSASVASLPSQQLPLQDSAEIAQPEKPPLEGLQVVIMHMKDTHQDGPLVGERILKQLVDHEKIIKDGDGDERLGDGIGLGVEWIISKVGESYWV
jgi:hypothetical protein